MHRLVNGREVHVDVPTRVTENRAGARLMNNRARPGSGQDSVSMSSSVMWSSASLLTEATAAQPAGARAGEVGLHGVDVVVERLVPLPVFALRPLPRASAR